MHGAPITIKCDCGERRLVGYGDNWTCESCGKTWDTTQIPAEEYWGVMRELRRYRLAVALLTAAVLGVLVPLALLISPAYFVLAILILGTIWFYILPKWRGRVLARVSGRPSWQLHPE